MTFRNNFVKKDERSLSLHHGQLMEVIKDQLFVIHRTERRDVL